MDVILRNNNLEAVHFTQISSCSWKEIMPTMKNFNCSNRAKQNWISVFYANAIVLIHTGTYLRLSFQCHVACHVTLLPCTCRPKPCLAVLKSGPPHPPTSPCDMNTACHRWGLAQAAFRPAGGCVVERWWVTVPAWHHRCPALWFDNSSWWAF